MQCIRVDTEAANVRMSCNEIEAAELFALGDGGNRLRDVRLAVVNGRIELFRRRNLQLPF